MAFLRIDKQYYTNVTYFKKTYVDARFIACVAVVIQLWGEGRLYE